MAHKIQRKQEIPVPVGASGFVFEQLFSRLSASILKITTAT